MQILISDKTGAYTQMAKDNIESIQQDPNIPPYVKARMLNGERPNLTQYIKYLIEEDQKKYTDG